MKNLAWVVYPIVVFGLMVVGVNFWLSGGVESLDTMLVKPARTENEQKEVALLRTKVEQLKQVDKDKLIEQLRETLAVVPPAKRVWLLMAELNRSATMAGMTIQSYRAAVGDMKEATESAQPVSDLTTQALTLTVEYDEADFPSLIKLLEALQKMKPLVRVTKVDYDVTGVRLTVDSAWAGWQKTILGKKIALPEYQGEVNKAVRTATGLQEVTLW
jgi:hypothetical protein